MPPSASTVGQQGAVSLSEEEWEQQKDNVRRLFLGLGWTQKQIRSFLERSLGGRVVSANQVQHRLRKWGFRRNLKESEWKQVASRIRQRIGKKSVVIVSGRRLPQKTVQTAISRYIRPTLLPEEPDVNAPNEDFRVETPEPLEENQPPWPKSLPWLKFQEYLSSLQVTFSIDGMNDDEYLLTGIQILVLGCVTNRWHEILLRSDLGGHARSEELAASLARSLSVCQLAVRLSSMIPESYPQENIYRADALLRCSGVDMYRETVNLLIFQISNGLLPRLLGLERCVSISEWCCHLRHYRDTQARLVLRTGQLCGLFKPTVIKKLAVVAESQPVIASLLTALLEAATYLEELDLSFMLLRNLASPDMPGWAREDIEAEGHRLLELALCRRNASLVTMLLEAGIAPTIWCRFFTQMDQPIEGVSFLPTSSSQSTVSELADIQLRYGAAILCRRRCSRGSPLLSAIKRGDIALANLLLAFDEMQGQRYFSRRSAHTLRCLLPIQVAGAFLRPPMNAVFMFFAVGFPWPESAFYEGPRRNEDLVENEKRAFDMVKLLRSYSARLTRALCRVTPDVLVVAASRGYTGILRYYHGGGVKLDVETSQGITPLAAAVGAGQVETYNYLLALGLSPNPSPSSSSLSALHLAAIRGSPTLVLHLLRHGADANAVYHRAAKRVGGSCCGRYDPKFLTRVNSKSTLFFAIREGNDATAASLLEFGACFSPNDAIRAANFGLATTVQIMVQSGFDPSTTCECSNSMIHAALLGRHYSIVDMLLTAGARIQGGELALLLSSNYHSESDEEVSSRRRTFELLLKQGANPNDVRSDQSTALQCAIRGGDGFFVSRLLEAGAALIGGELVHAFIHGDPIMVHMLLDRIRKEQKPIETSFEGISCLEAAILGANTLLTELAFEIDQRGYDSGALCAAVLAEIEGSSDGILERLLSQRGRLPLQLGSLDMMMENTAISFAAKVSRADILDRLLSCYPMEQLDQLQQCSDRCYARTAGIVSRMSWRDARIRRSGVLVTESSILAEASSSGNQRIIEALLSAGFSSNVGTLQSAIGRGAPLAIIELLAPSQDCIDDKSFTISKPLETAVQVDRTDVVQYLLRSYGANPNEPRLSTWGALRMAVEKQNHGMVLLLLNANADVNLPTNRSTVLRIAASHGFLSLVRQLWHKGADLNARRAVYGRKTTLESAAEHGRLEVVQFLLSSGVLITGKWRIHFIRAVHFARRNGHTAVARLLKSEGHWCYSDQEQIQDKRVIGDRIGFYYFHPLEWDEEELPGAIAGIIKGPGDGRAWMEKQWWYSDLAKRKLTPKTCEKASVGSSRSNVLAGSRMDGLQAIDSGTSMSPNGREEPAGADKEISEAMEVDSSSWDMDAFVNWELPED